MHRAPAVDFGQVTGRGGIKGMGGDMSTDPLEGVALDLNPQPEVVLPSHPSVVMHPDPNAPPPRRQRRWPVVRADGGDESLLVDIERAIAEAGPPPAPPA